MTEQEIILIHGQLERHLSNSEDMQWSFNGEQFFNLFEALNDFFTNYKVEEQNDI